MPSRLDLLIKIYASMTAGESIGSIACPYIRDTGIVAIRMLRKFQEVLPEISDSQKNYFGKESEGSETVRHLPDGCLSTASR